MDINSIIGYLEKTEGLIVPPDVQFSSYDVMTTTAFTQGWLEVPTLEKLQTTWELIKTDIENQNLLEQKRQLALLNLENNFNQSVSLGYYDADFNITLALGDYDRTMFNQLLTMLKLAEELNQTIEEIPISDINNALHLFTVPNLKMLLLGYGFYYQTIWSNYGANKQRILNEMDISKL